jgi:thiopeptide-type bacteriocin biosynthesis protein
MAVSTAVSIDEDLLCRVLRPILGERTGVFVTAGLDAVISQEVPSPWLQWGLSMPPGQCPALYAALLDLTTTLIDQGVVKDFFFMHKPPGLRIRFRVDPDALPGIRDDLGDRLAGWQADSLVDGVTSGVYEPEQQLFGGPVAMPHVHRLFTADSLAWLTREGVGDPGPAWAFSLAVLASVLPAMGIHGWEDIEVWQRIREQCHRRVPADLDPARVAAVATGVRAAWADPGRLRSDLSAGVSAALDTHGPAMTEAAARWREEYFTDPGAIIGPREATAFFVIFHWNRGGLTPAAQALVTAALADRTARP